MEKGQIMIICGEGKGKTSAAIGRGITGAMRWISKTVTEYTAVTCVFPITGSSGESTACAGFPLCGRVRMKRRRFGLF